MNHDNRSRKSVKGIRRSRERDDAVKRHPITLPEE